jgi:transposase
MDIENKAIAKARKEQANYIPKTLGNADTPKQLLARVRYILAKKESQWTPNQQQRAQLLFTNYPEIQVAYQNVIKLRAIYEERQYLNALVRLKRWIDNTRKLNIK